ncbi:MAG: STAS domain-containing protein [Bryobacteraceae bacterium]
MTLSTDETTGMLRIAGMLDIDVAQRLRESLLNCLSLPPVAVDLSRVEGCDAAALQVLLAACRHSTAAGNGLQLHALSPSISETASALGFSIAVSAEASAGSGPDGR